MEIMDRDHLLEIAGILGMNRSMLEKFFCEKKAPINDFAVFIHAVFFSLQYIVLPI